MPDKLGVTFDKENAPYLYSDTIKGIVHNPYVGWNQNIEFCLYDTICDTIIGHCVPWLAPSDILGNYDTNSVMAVNGYWFRDDNKPLATGEYVLQIFDKTTGCSVSERYKVNYELPKLDILEIKTNDFTTENFWLFRVKVKNNNPYPVALQTLVVSGNGDSEFDSAIHSVKSFSDYFTQIYEPGEEMIREFCRPHFREDGESTPGIAEFAFNAKLNNTTGITGSLDDIEFTLPDIGIIPANVNEHRFSVQVYDKENAPEHSNIPEISLNNIDIRLQNDTLNISFDFQVVNGAVTSHYMEMIEENHAIGGCPISFEICEKNIYSWLPLGHLGFNEIFGGLTPSSNVPTNSEYYCLFEGESRHFHFKIGDSYKQNYMKLGIPYILSVSWDDPYIHHTFVSDIPRIFTYEYTLKASGIENVINNKSNSPTTIYTLNGIKNR